VRTEFRGDGSISSTDINQIAHDRWDTLGVTDKDVYERKALHANSNYVMDLMSEVGYLKIIYEKSSCMSANDFIYSER
jgi:hypothetical protein